MAVDYHSVLIPQGIYHFYNKAVSGRKLFQDHSDYQRFMDKFKNYFHPYLYLLAYCLIPNHYHFLVLLKEENDEFFQSVQQENSKAGRLFLSGQYSMSEFLSDQFRKLLSSHSLYVNKKYKRNGPLLRTKSKRTEVSSEIKLWDLLCYIHHNPIHHGLTESYTQWFYSSYSGYFSKELDLGYEKVLEWLGDGNLSTGLLEYEKMHQNYKMNFER